MCEVLLGDKHLKTMYNLIFILGKKYINACKYGNTIPNIHGFMAIVRSTKQIEMYIAKRKQNMEKHNDKWLSFQMIQT